MIKVYLRAGDKLDFALKRFRKLCEKEGLQKELKKHAFYEKPSDKKRRLKRKAERRAKQSVLSKQRQTKQKKVDLSGGDSTF